jgi:hypothetical protein
MRVAARLRNLSDIGDLLDVVRTQERQEFREGSGRMPDGVNRHGS